MDQKQLRKQIDAYEALLLDCIPSLCTDEVLVFNRSDFETTLHKARELASRGQRGGG